VALLDAGAYGMAQSSNYNTRPRAADPAAGDYCGFAGAGNDLIG
jgi:hypothetical protein